MQACWACRGRRFHKLSCPVLKGKVSLVLGIVVAVIVVGTIAGTVTDSFTVRWPLLLAALAVLSIARFALRRESGVAHPPLFILGASVRVVEDVPSDREGLYTVTDVGPDAVTLSGPAGQALVLSPRHPALRDTDGNVIDPWVWCNVFVDGALTTYASTRPVKPPDVLLVELGC